MSAPLSARNPGRSEFSHGKGRHPHPDSDYQTGVVGLPYQPADRNQGSKRGGLTQALRQQMELRMDPTNAQEVFEPDMYEVAGNPDFYPDQKPLVEEKRVIRRGVFKQPVYRTGVARGGY